MTSTQPITELATRLIEQISAQVRMEIQAKGGAIQQPSGRLLTAKQAATYIGRSEQAIRHMIFQRDIPVVRDGRCVRIDKKDLDTWIENNKT